MMKSELQKSLDGEFYNCHDPFFLECKRIARDYLIAYNALRYDEKEKKYAILSALFSKIGKGSTVAQPFCCDYGRNIELGEHVSVNMNCTFVDCNRIVVGDRTLIASNVQIYTAAHPLGRAERINPLYTAENGEPFFRTFARPVVIGCDCWIGGGVVILPGVTIGDGAVIGGGAVVVHDIPPNALAVGNPARVIRTLNAESTP